MTLGKSLFPLFAAALNLSENFFDDKVCSAAFPAITLYTEFTHLLDEELSRPHACAALPTANRTHG